MFFKNVLNNSLRKNLAIFFSGNILALCITVIIQFTFPKVLSVENYGLYKTFTLYLSFTSLLHLGLKDGIYLRLCEDKVFNKGNNITYFSFLFFQQLIILIIMVIISIFFKAPLKLVLLCLAFTSLFFILNTYYDSFFQSKKNFLVVSSLKIFKEATFLFIVIILFFLLDNIEIQHILLAFLSSVALTTLFYSYKARSYVAIKRLKKEDFHSVKTIYNRGFKQILGNFGNQINTNIDKLFVNFFFTVKEFAYYSFGGMFFVLTNTFVGSIATVLLPYLIGDEQNNLERKYEKLLKFSTIFSIVLFFYLLLMFVLVFYFYKEYCSSIIIIALFYGAMVYNVKINVIQNNYLKTMKLDKQYIVNNYLILGLFIIFMSVLFVFKIPLVWYSLVTSIIMFLRYRLNHYSIQKNFKKKNIFLLHDVFTIVLGVIIFIIAKNFI
ncbi:lipopolysaccharide biosynthesis protein [Hyunsoonleella sp. 2307UL5-6]|uniref:lipopolysaccharide biosynthesis protein n=1 Tax=Hyunsoonleella sp. 2307UL5-6 TaxID=3384768 RepID=UPI0039BD8CC6